MSGRSKNHTLKGGTSPYSLCMGLPSPPPGGEGGGGGRSRRSVFLPKTKLLVAILYVSGRTDLKLSVFLIFAPILTICLNEKNNNKKLHFYLSIYLSIYLSVYLSVCLSVHLSIDRSIYPKMLITRRHYLLQFFSRKSIPKLRFLLPSIPRPVV